MKIVGSSFLKYFVAAIVAVAAISYVSSKRTPRLNQSSTVATREFNHPEDADQSWIGPPIGERIELVHLKDERGRTLSEVIGDGLSMLALVDPGCAAPMAASNQLTMVKEAVKQVWSNDELSALPGKLRGIPEDNFNDRFILYVVLSCRYPLRRSSRSSARSAPRFPLAAFTRAAILEDVITHDESFLPRYSLRLNFLASFLFTSTHL